MHSLHQAAAPQFAVQYHYDGAQGRDRLLVSTSDIQGRVTLLEVQPQGELVPVAQVRTKKEAGSIHRTGSCAFQFQPPKKKRKVQPFFIPLRTARDGSRGAGTLGRLFGRHHRDGGRGCAALPVVALGASRGEWCAPGDAPDAAGAAAAAAGVGLAQAEDAQAPPPSLPPAAAQAQAAAARRRRSDGATAHAVLGGTHVYIKSAHETMPKEENLLIGKRTRFTSLLLSRWAPCAAHLIVGLLALEPCHS